MINESLNEQQQEIYQGLSAIGPEIAAFYLDGVQIVESNFRTRSYLVGHIMREIDGGLRNIFEHKHEKKKLQEKIQDEELMQVFSNIEYFFKGTDYLSEVTFNDFKEAKGHISSVIASFGLDMDHPLTVQYIKVVIWLNKYAHRSGAFNEPRSSSDIIRLWNEFEDLLSKLIGSYYSIADRLDTIISTDSPSEYIIYTLPNLLKEQSREWYFFSNLKHIGWLVRLYEEGYFDASNNPFPIESQETPGAYSYPYWPILSYLNFVGNENLKNPSPTTSKILSSIIIDNYFYKDKSGNRIDNYRTDYALFELIQILPAEYIRDEHFLFIEAALKGQLGYHLSFGFTEFIERLIALGNKEFLLRGVDLLLMTHIQEDSYGDKKVHSILGDYYMETILDSIKPKLIPVIGYDLYERVIKRIYEFLDLNPYFFSSTSIPSLSKNEEVPASEEYECQLIFLFRDILESLDKSQISDILSDFLDSDISIFHRLAIYIIDIRYQEFKELLWQMDINPLSLSDSEHEVYQLFSHNSKYFTHQEIDHVINWIKTVDFYIPEYETDINIIDKSIAYKKREWLTAISSYESDNIRHLTKELELIDNREIEFSGFRNSFSMAFGYKSPITLEELTQMSIKEVIEYFIKFSKEEHSALGPDPAGFIDMVLRAVTNYPTKYNNNCDDIIDAPPEIKNAWIKGIWIAWREKPDFKCNEVITTSTKIIKKKDFWASYNSGDRYNEYFLLNLLSLISEGLQENEYTFKKPLMPLIKDILFIVLRNDLRPPFEYDELVLKVLNSIKGKTYMSLLQLSLTFARYDNKESFGWDSDIKQFFADEINSGKENQVLYYILGRFFHNIQYLDEAWLNDNFEKVFPIGVEENWTASISGYYSGQNKLPQKFYFNLFDKDGHLEKCLLSTNLDRESFKNLTHHICMAYLYGFEEAELESNIIHLLTKTVNEKIISKMIYIFKDSRVPTTSTAVDSSKKVRMMWEKIYKRAYKLENKQQDIMFLSGCCTWLINIDKIDDKLLEIILSSVQYLNSHDRRNFYNALLKHIHTTPQEVGAIMVELAKGDVYYDLSRDKIKDLVTTLYKNGVKDKADKICNLHGEKGVDFLRKIYAENNT